MHTSSKAVTWVMYLLEDHIMTKIVKDKGCIWQNSRWLSGIQDGVEKNANKLFYELDVIT